MFATGRPQRRPKPPTERRGTSDSPRRSYCRSSSSKNFAHISKVTARIHHRLCFIPSSFVLPGLSLMPSAEGEHRVAKETFLCGLPGARRRLRPLFALSVPWHCLPDGRAHSPATTFLNWLKPITDVTLAKPAAADCHVTTKQSLGPSSAIAFASAFLSVTTPLIYSENSEPAWRSADCCASSDCPSVLTLA
jgi:hypothetical protein